MTNVPVAVVTVPPAVTLVPLIVSEAMLSPPVEAAIVPLAISLFAAESEPAGSLPRAGRPDSATSLSPAASIVGTESRSNVIVAVVVDTSPSPSVIEYWNVTLPCSPGAGV